MKQKQVILKDRAENKSKILLFELNSKDSVLHKVKLKQPPIMINLKTENKNYSMELDMGDNDQCNKIQN